MTYNSSARPVAMLNVPNILSLFRILLVPLMVVVLFTKPKYFGQEWIGLGLFLLASLTDFLDGFLARRRKQITRLGQILDPAADKILTSAAFISLVELNPRVVPAWIVVVIIAREFAVTSLRSFAAAERIVIPAAASGKLKTTLQIVAISLLIVYNELGEFRHLAPISLWAAMLVTAWSGVDYFVQFGRRLIQSEGPPGTS